MTGTKPQVEKATRVELTAEVVLTDELLSFFKKGLSEQLKEHCLDVLIFGLTDTKQAKIKVKTDNGETHTGSIGGLNLRVPTNFFTTDTGVFCSINGQRLDLEIAQAIKDEGDDWETWRANLDASNRELGLMAPALESKALPTIKSANFNFATGQESDWLLRAACDGERQNGYRKDAQRRALIYEQNGASHRVELTQDAPETDGETLEMDALEWLATQQNADFGFTFFYVVRLLAPPEQLEANRFAGGWIDLDDVAAKIGYNLDRCTAIEREKLRAQVWQFINFGARALVIGRRKQYLDRATGKEIETRVESPPWRILDVERPVQTAMFGETPRRVQLLISKSWEPLLTAPNLAQYLPFAEIVGSIPANQTAGAWARVLGKALANFWRRKPQEATGAAPAILPTRRELLTHYTPKKNPPLELLASPNPKRAVKYWRDALAMLRERGFIAPDGEAARTVAQMLEPFGRKDWQEDWLNERVDLRPGPVVMDAICKRAAAKPVRKPRALNAPKRKPRHAKPKPD